MIQRVQTLFLLGVTILMFFLAFVPIWEKKAPTKVSTLNEKIVLKAFNLSAEASTVQNAAATTVKIKESTWYIAALAILCGIIAFASIFQFKKRLLQLKLGVLNTILISGTIGTIFLGINKGDKLMPGDNQEFLLGFYLPLVALLLNFMANRFIRKDEALVRSVDRIR